MASIRTVVRKRANNRCEYCQLPQAYDARPFQLDHIRPQKHDGPTTLENLAFACFPDNVNKGPNASGYDPSTNELVALFNPRTQPWHDHFRWNGPLLIGISAIGRATIHVMKINAADRIEHRRLLVEAGLFPPNEALDLDD